MAGSDALWQPDFAANSTLFAPLHALKIPFATLPDFPKHEQLTIWASARGLRTATGLPLHFVPMQPKPRRARSTGPLYEEIVHTTGGIPTRAGCWHDFFNAMSWLLYPLTKAALVERRVATTTAPGRSREQQRMAMLDEGGLILARATARPTLPCVFGHAVWEQAVAGSFEATCFAMAFDVPAGAEATLAGFIPLADATIAARVRSGFLADYDSAGVPIRPWHRPTAI